MEQTHTSDFPKTSIDLRKTAYLTLRLQPAAKTLDFRFLIKQMLCGTFQMFGRRINKVQRGLRRKNEQMVGDAVTVLREASVPFAISQRPDFHNCVF